MCFQFRTIQRLVIPSKVPVYCILIWRIGCCCCWLLLNWDNILTFSNTKDFIQPSFCSELFLCFVSYLITNHSNQEISKKRSSFDWNLEQIKDPGEFNFSPHQQLLSFITFVHQNIKFFIRTYLFSKTQAIHTVLLTHRAGEIFSLFRGIWQILERYCIADHPGVGGGVMLNFLPKLKVLVTFHLRVCL